MSWTWVKRVFRVLHNKVSSNIMFLGVLDKKNIMNMVYGGIWSHIQSLSEYRVSNRCPRSVGIPAGP